MIIDMPITSQTIDSSGEILHLQGLDIADFLEGRAWANFEHNNDHSEDIVGKFISAKKIFSEKDCENDRQRAYWNKLKTPFLYGVCELLDQEGHIGAICVAAMIRYFKKRNEPVMVGASIEGQTMKRQDGDLLRTVGRRVAITLRPCNRQCWVDFMSDGADAAGMFKSEFDRPVTGLIEMDSTILEDGQPEGDAVHQLKKALQDFSKTLEAGGYNVAPANLTGGSALQVEDSNLHQKIHDVGFRDQKNKIKSVYRDWDRKRPFKEILKAAMPELSDDFVDHFEELMDELALKKSANAGTPNQGLVRISADHSGNAHDNEQQKKLLEGMYWNMAEPFTPAHKEHLSDMKVLQNDAGQKVFTKYAPANYELGEHDTGTKYYHLANDLYGMGEHVPVTTHFSHANVHNGEPVHASEFILGSKTPLESQEAWVKAAQRAREDGSLHKLALMDMINGTADRHLGNVLIHPNGKLLNIDNDMGLSEIGHEPGYLAPSHGFEGIGNDTLHQDAKRWLETIGPKALLLKTHHYGVPLAQRKAMLTRLELLRRASDAGQSFGQMVETMKKLGLMI